MAVVASLLLHAIMLMTLSSVSLAGNGFTWPVQMPLSVLIEKPTPARKATPPVHVSNPMVVNAKRAPPARSAEAASASPPSAVDVPQYPAQPGVSVSEMLYPGSIPARVTSPLLLDETYRPATDISEPPSAIAIRIPTYPLPAQEQKSSGWVIVMLFLDERGRVVDTVALTSSESFSAYEESVAAQLQGSFYAPGKLDGQAVKTRMFAKVRFDFGRSDVHCGRRRAAA